MNKSTRTMERMSVNASGWLFSWALILSAALLMGCRGEQALVLDDHVAYLAFSAIEPGAVSDFDELYALTGNYAKDELKIQSSGIPGGLAGGPTEAQGVQKLRIFHINDLHHHLSDRLGDVTEYRAARISRLIKDARQVSAEDEAILFISAGDDAAGTRFDELIGYKASEFTMHPGYRTYSEIGMDVAVLGNHEFDWGAELLGLSVEKSAAFPVISSNVMSPDPNWPVYGSLVGVINGFRVGFVGFTPAGDLPLQALASQGFTVLGVAEQLAKLIPLLDPYVDLYILISHLGYDADPATGVPIEDQAFGDTRTARLLSELTSKPAMILGGHSHTVLNKNGLEPGNIVNDIPIFQAGAFGQWLGDAGVVLTAEPSAVTASYSARLITINTHGGQASVDSQIDKGLQDHVILPMEHMLSEKFDTVIGSTVTGPELSASQTALDRYTGESALLNILTSAIIVNSTKWPEGPVDFAAINATSASGGLEAGSEVSYGDVYSLMPFADTVFLLQLSGQQIKNIIENNARRIWHVEEFTPAGGQLDPAQYHGGGFLHFSSGIRYSISTDLNTGFSSAEDISLNGITIEKVLAETFKIAVPRYVATGRGDWSGGPLRDGDQQAIPLDMRALVTAHGYDTGRVWRNELLTYFKLNGRQLTEQSNRLKDGRALLKN